MGHLAQSAFIEFLQAPNQYKPMPCGEDGGGGVEWGVQTSVLDCELLSSPLGRSVEIPSQSKTHKCHRGCHFMVTYKMGWRIWERPMWAVKE